MMKTARFLGVCTGWSYERCACESTQEGHVAYPGYMHLGVQEGFLEQGTRFLTFYSPLIFFLILAATVIVQALFVSHLNYSNSFPTGLISTLILVPNAQFIL